MLGDLVAFWQIRVEVVFSSVFVPFTDIAAASNAQLDGVVDDFVVCHRQRARQGQ